MDQRIRDARKLLFSGTTVVCLIGVVGFCWFIYAEFFPTLYDVVVSAPVLRIYPGSIGIPAIVIFLLMVYLGIILRAIPARESTLKLGRPLFIGSFFLMLFSFIPGALVVGWAQHFYFPKYSYTECDQLQGAPSVWFTDWVKNPAWCVKGKDRAWVFERAQADLTREASDAKATK
jgi:hypothetical protein